ncbi:colicin D domain-containing protein [Lentzea californiensis]|uniref:colicin D domain-containing protein n=1 Tax=Lentzea californiensis TaxID=438851 RepID=UPI002165A453|nr:colicin D domain-containing protein [Lentzea californiensis]MCR3749675.1 hypothetical protein [Lentzea californiensis]
MRTPEWRSVYVESQGKWLLAKEIRAGDQLRTDTGVVTAVTGTRAWAEERPVFNLTVDGVHTYYVSAAGQDVLVHNSGPCPQVTFDKKVVEKKYREHALDFGFPDTKYNYKNGVEFQGRIMEHIQSPDVFKMDGFYRGNMAVDHYLIPKTSVNVMIDKNGKFVSGWKLSPDQLRNVMFRGTL